MAAIGVADAAGTWGDGELKEEGVPVGAMSSSSAPQAARRPAAKMRGASKNSARHGCEPPVGIGSRFMRLYFLFKEYMKISLG